MKNKSLLLLVPCCSLRPLRLYVKTGGGSPAVPISVKIGGGSYYVFDFFALKPYYKVSN
ncbi:MAG: hypothetical protein H0U49_05980 [Parachlamydiaceae bacterium]|nr:hypothetical protein [Parachlamydiaceae bacterium]